MQTYNSSGWRENQIALCASAKKSSSDGRKQINERDL